jgi:single-strand DNA-binding protein
MIVVQIAGRLGKDPETRFTSSGQKVTNLTVATNVRKGGKEETVWWRVTIWGDRFDKMMAYLKKGSAVIVVGEMGKPEIWTDKEGKPQVTLEITAEIIRFSPFGSGERQEQGATQPASTGYAQNTHTAHGTGQAHEQRGDFNAYKSNAADMEFQPVQPGQNHSHGHNMDNEDSLPF